MDSPFYSDLRPPHNTVAPASVTLATTDKALHLAANIGNLGNPNWPVGKNYRVLVRGQCTSAATPGNLTVSLYWGTGADANGTVLCATAATAWTASQANMTFEAEFDVTVTALGATGSIVAGGRIKFNEAAIAAELMAPATGGDVAVTVDTTTSANVFSVQAKRSGSTAETVQLSAGYPKVFALN